MNRAALGILLALTVSSLASAQEICEAQRVVPPSTIGTTDFGLAVTTNGEQWFVGSSQAMTLCSGSPLSCSTGAVFVYDNIDGQLVHAQTIVPPDVELYDNFGTSLDVDGDRLIVGSPYSRSPDSDLRTGAAFIYEFDGTHWVEVNRIWPPLRVTREFAVAVELSDGKAIVTPLDTNEALVFDRDTLGDWALTQTIEHPDPSAPASGFGGVWAVHGEWYVTGAYLDRQVVPNGGAVFVYRRDASGLLQLEQEILADDEWMYLGISLAFDGDTLVVAAPLASRDLAYQGVVRFYEFDGSQWVLDGELTQDDARENRQFGNRVLAHDGRLFVSAFNERTPESRGMVHSFERGVNGQWTQADRWEPSPVEYAGHYGTAMAAAGEHLIVGARKDEAVGGGLVGAAYFFDLACGDCEADLDADGTLTIFDFLTFLNLFQDGDATADFDGDGELTIFDFLAFQTAFDAGCE